MKAFTFILLLALALSLKFSEVRRDNFKKKPLKYFNEEKEQQDEPQKEEEEEPRPPRPEPPEEEGERERPPRRPHHHGRHRRRHDRPPKNFTRMPPPEFEDFENFEKNESDNRTHPFPPRPPRPDDEEEERERPPRPPKEGEDEEARPFPKEKSTATLCDAFVILSSCEKINRRAYSAAAAHTSLSGIYDTVLDPNPPVSDDPDRLYHTRLARHKQHPEECVPNVHTPKTDPGWPSQRNPEHNRHLLPAVPDPYNIRNAPRKTSSS